MTKRVTEIIEAVAFLVLAILVGLWAWSQDGRYEPWTAVCGLVAGGLEIYRRFFLTDDTKGEGPPGDTARSLHSWLIAHVPTKVLSETLPRALRLAQKLGDSEFEKWIRLELYGYRGENGMAKSDVVPEYRSITGLHYDVYHRPLLIRDPKIAFINTLRLRCSVRELEEYAASEKSLYLMNEEVSAIIREHLEVDVAQFGFNPASVAGILNSIRGKLLDNLHRIEDRCTG